MTITMTTNSDEVGFVGGSHGLFEGILPPFSGETNANHKTSVKPVKSLAEIL